MGAFLAELAPLVAVTGVGMALIAVAATRSLPAALPLLLDMLLAAGLLRITVATGWIDLAGVAVIIAVRRLIVIGLAQGHLARRRPPARP